MPEDRKWVTQVLRQVLIGTRRVTGTRREWSPDGEEITIEFKSFPDMAPYSFHDALVDLILCNDPESPYQALEAAAVSLMQVAEAARKLEK